MKDYTLLIERASEVMKSSYAPYSGFNVGSAILCADGSIYTGCNVESSSYGATICAERSALASAIADGKRDFVAIAIVGGKNMSIGEYVFPCGICRQVLSELCQGTLEIVLFDGKKPKIHTLSKLFPNGFKL